MSGDVFPPDLLNAGDYKRPRGFSRERHRSKEVGVVAGMGIEQKPRVYVPDGWCPFAARCSSIGFRQRRESALTYPKIQEVDTNTIACGTPLVERCFLTLFSLCVVSFVGSWCVPFYLNSLPKLNSVFSCVAVVGARLRQATATRAIQAGG